jgi:hypothetical protein
MSRQEKSLFSRIYKFYQKKTGRLNFPNHYLQINPSLLAEHIIQMTTLLPSFIESQLVSERIGVMKK